MVQIAVVALVAIVAVILGLAAMKPDRFRVERSIAIAAPADKVYPLIADFREWPSSRACRPRQARA